MKCPRFFKKAHEVGFQIPKFQKNKMYYEGTKCLILDGKRVSEHFLEQAKHLVNQKNVPRLAVILVGENKASAVYVKSKIKFFERAGLLADVIKVSAEEASTENLRKQIEVFNADDSIHGVLVQLPLPDHLKTGSILSALNSRKDVDGFSAQNLGLLVLNERSANIACTPFGIMILLSAYGIDVQGKNCVVIGRSRIVGKPMGLFLLNENATVTLVHSHTKNIFEHTRKADIVIVAVGKRYFLKKEHIKPGAVVIDVGIHKNDDGVLSGDVHPDTRFNASALTPVPRGVGPMTVAALLINTCLSV